MNQETNTTMPDKFDLQGMAGFIIAAISGFFQNPIQGFAGIGGLVLLIYSIQHKRLQKKQTEIEIQINELKLKQQKEEDK